MLSGFPRYQYKEYKKTLEKLVKEGYVLLRPKPRGIKYGITSRKIKEVIELVEKEEP